MADDVERMYRETLSRTPLRSDRGDLGLQSFAGSALHGGKPALEKPAYRSGGTDLYAPLQRSDYGPGYYDGLRARTPPPRAPAPRLGRRSSSGDENWVPLTTHIYKYSAGPHSSHTYRSGGGGLYDYTYADDFHRYATTTTTRTKNVVDSSYSSRSERY